MIAGYLRNRPATGLQHRVEQYENSTAGCNDANGFFLADIAKRHLEMLDLPASTT